MIVEQLLSYQKKGESRANEPSTQAILENLKQLPIDHGTHSENRSKESDCNCDEF